MTVSKSNTYGTLTITKATGVYNFVADNAVIESLTTDISDIFTITVTNGSMNDSKILTMNITQNGMTESISDDTLTGTEENDTMNGLAGNDFISSLAGADLIVGGIGSDTLIGNRGADTLRGGQGDDTLNGGNGLDTFRLNSLSFIDTITDFVVADDTLQLVSSVFTRLTTGVLNPTNFTIGTSAIDADDYLIYNYATGTLLYDTDGNGASSAVQIALLGTNLALTNADFTIV
jgi:Ca2+-binding RTX toxin-like protein